MKGVLAAFVTAMIVISGCTSLSERECLESPAHTLVVSEKDGGYTCKVARNVCEKGFVQAEHDAEFCEANSLCKFSPGKCFCSEGLQCICGGGPPSSCQPKQ
jgi:hypothetical protein